MTALVKLVLVFVGIVVLLSRKWNLGLVLVLASVAIGLLFSYPLPETGRDIFLTIIDVPTLRLAFQADSVADALAILRNADILALRLALIVALIMVMGELLRQTASTQGMVEALQALNPNGRVVIAALPALIGLLPMVGGAMLSAPMVDEVGNRLEASKARRTFINYWFRHIWEPVFPLYPSMMLGAALLGLTTVQMIRATWPLAVAAVLGGMLFGLLGLPRRDDADPLPIPRAQSLRTLVTSIWPIALVIVLSLTLPVDDRLTLILSLLVTITLMMWIKGVPLRELVATLRERIPWKMVAVIFGALIFRRVLENSGAVIAVAGGLTALHIPPAVVAFAVPSIAGLLTGLMAAGFSIGFPVVLPLIIADGGTIGPEWATWLMAAGYLGTMYSPLHLCLALTRGYFEAEWGAVYRLLVPAGLLLAATAAGMLLLDS